jgi:hypothetical protein
MSEVERRSSDFIQSFAVQSLGYHTKNTRLLKRHNMAFHAVATECLVCPGEHQGRTAWTFCTLS